jgi:hypothetical protein
MIFCQDGVEAMRTSAHARTAKPSPKSVAKGRAAKRSAHAAPASTVAPETKPRAKPLNDEERRALIAQAAYLRAEKRGFSPGQELDDWLAAESEIDGQPLLAHQLAHSDT